MQRSLVITIYCNYMCGFCLTWQYWQTFFLTEFQVSELIVLAQISLLLGLNLMMTHDPRIIGAADLLVNCLVYLMRSK